MILIHDLKKYLFLCIQINKRKFQIQFKYLIQKRTFVSALEIGGLTPSKAVVRRCLQISDIPTMVMVRHHNQGFFLNKQQKDLLIEQAIGLVELGSKGLVIGAITQHNCIDQQFLDDFEKEISNTKVDITFHKASDQTPNLLQAYNIMQKYNINRVLTQGGKRSILENGLILKQVINSSKIKTLIGGGININNIVQIKETINPKQVHIGTCVRSKKYGPIDSKLLQQFTKVFRS